jgi:hypothetical protein
VPPRLNNPWWRVRKPVRRETFRLAVDVKRFDFTLELNQQRIAAAVKRTTGWHHHPSLTDAVFRYVTADFAIEVNSNIVFENRLDVMRAFGINGKSVG